MSISVLEYAELDMLQDIFFVGNELAITAFISIKDDVDKQCSALVRLKEVGIVGIILYYVGVFIPELDQRVIDTAEEVGLPLIVMPQNEKDFRYGEVLSEVDRAIYDDQQAEHDYVFPILEIVSQLKDRQRTLNTVLRLLSDRLNITFLLTDSEVELLETASWPMSRTENYIGLLQHYKAISQTSSGLDVFEYAEDGKTLHVRRQPIRLANGVNLNLFAVSVQAEPSHRDLIQSAEIISLFCATWNVSLQMENRDMILPAIIKGEHLLVRKLTMRYGLDLGKFSTLWVVKNGGGQREKTAKGQEGRFEAERIASCVRVYLNDQKKNALAAVINDTAVALLEASQYLDLDADLDTGFVNYSDAAMKNGETTILLTANRLADASSIQDIYHSFAERENELRAIYPDRRVFNKHHLAFAKKCHSIVAEGDAFVQEYTSLLAPLTEANHSDSLITTLSVYLLDADRNLQSTATSLFLHGSSIKYRIGACKKLLGININTMPDAYDLYLAVALMRLIQAP
jgi:DNA-binding PucR family transcriptional regulator